eukprot:5417423-Amphidinium_carterae.1
MPMMVTMRMMVVVVMMVGPYQYCLVIVSCSMQAREPCARRGRCWHIECSLLSYTVDSPPFCCHKK